MSLPPVDENSTWESLLEFITSELEQARHAHREVTMQLEQGQVELSHLTKRNASINAHLQQIQNQFESVPLDQIRMVYDSALEAQRHLLFARGQVEKWQSEQACLQQYIDALERVRNSLEKGLRPSGLRGSLGGMALLEKLIDAQEAERQKLSRQMHDGPAQDLSNFIVQAEIVSRLFDVDSSKAREELENLKNAAMATFQKVRLFISGLRPMMLDDLGLFPTIKRYVDVFREETGVDASLTVKGSEQRFASYAEVMLFRAIQELMTNAYRHNQDLLSKLQIQVALVVDDQVVKVIVSDNGKGLDVNQLQGSEGLGLRLIRERVEMLGGSLDIDSSLGKGCRVTLQIPVDNILM